MPRYSYCQMSFAFSGGKSKILLVLKKKKKKEAQTNIFASDFECNQQIAVRHSRRLSSADYVTWIERLALIALRSERAHGDSAAISRTLATNNVHLWTRAREIAKFGTERNSRATTYYSVNEANLKEEKQSPRDSTSLDYWSRARARTREKDRLPFSRT